MDALGDGIAASPAATQAPVAPAGSHRWRSLVFAPVGDGQRRRRGSDGIRLAAATAGLLCCVLIIHYGYRVDRVITRLVNPPPSSISWLVTVIYDAGSFGVTAVLIVLALLARRWVVARDIGLSVAGTVAVAGILVVLLGANGGRGSEAIIHGYFVRFPVIQIGIFMAVATAALPYLARPVQRLVEAFIALVALSSVVGGHGLPVNVLGSLAIGWGITSLVHLVFGSPLGLPATSDVVALLHELGVPATDVHPAARQEWGVASYGATLEPSDGGPAAELGVSVYGRDAADAKLLAKTGRFLFYRDSGPTLTFTRLQQVEHEAYLTLRAGQAGVDAPGVIEAGRAGPSGDALIVCRLPRGTMLSAARAGDVTDRMLDSLLGQLLTLRAARLAHGGISGNTVLLDRVSDTAVLTNYRNASSQASQYLLDRDLAGAIAAAAVVVGAERAAAAAARCLSAEVLTGVLQHLRRAGMDPILVRDLRGHKKLLDQVREQAARAKSIEVPKLAEPRRISWPNLILIIGTLIGGWALIGVLIDVTKSFDTIIGADWLWVIAAFILAQLAFAGSALEDLGSVAGQLPFVRVLVLEIANSFSGLAGGTAAVFGTRVRFFQQQGYDASVALSSGAAVTSVSWLVKTALFLISLPLAWGTLDLADHPTAGADKVVWVILVIVVAVGILIGVVFGVPKLRRLAAAKVRPRLLDMWANARSVATSPVKVSQLFGGAIVLQLAVALALGAALRAFGDHLSLPTLILVITLASVIGGVAPVPGGMGVVEAGLILGLTAAGIPEVDATAAVFIQRLFAAYLPPIWGWFSLMWLRRREYV